MNWPKGSLTNLFSFKKNSLNKNNSTSASSNPFLYTGTWYYEDGVTGRKHSIEIMPNYDVYLDKKILKTVVEHADEYQLTFIDKFGYHLTIKANKKQPISVYDEANNETYAILDTKNEN